MTSAEAFQLLLDAKDDDEKITLASIEIAVSSVSDEQQDKIREAIYAAAVSHWFDAAILRKVLSIDHHQASHLYVALRRFSFVEAFPRFQASCVHERTRSHVLAFLYREAKQKYENHSKRCHEYFQEGTAPQQIIEAAYHQLVCDPDAGATTIAHLYDIWDGQDAESLQALAASVGEHIQCHRLRDFALGMGLHIVASSLAPYQPLARTEAQLKEAVEVFRTLSRRWHESIVLLTLGDVQRARGDLATANLTYENALEIREKLAHDDPTDVDYQRGLSSCYNAVGRIREAQGGFATAQRLYETAMEIRRKLVIADPDNAERQRDLSLCHDNVGRIREERGDMEGAERSFASAREIAKQLAKRFPDNAEYQRDLSISYENLGSLQEQRGNLEEAELAFVTAMELTRKLFESDPTNTNRHRDLSVLHNRLGAIKKGRADMDGARQSFEAAMAIRQKLVETDPDNATWKRDLSVSHNNIGRIYEAEKNFSAARRSFEAAREIRYLLAQMSPENIESQQDLAFSHGCVGKIQKATGDLVGARRSFGAAFEILQELAKRDPLNRAWQESANTSRKELADLTEGEN